MIKAGAAAAILGGAAWVAKAGWILLTGNEPPLFGVGLFLFPLALLGLYSLARRTRSGLATAGGVSTVVAFLGAVGAGAIAVVLPDQRPTEESFTLISPFIAVAGFGAFIAILLISVVIVRHNLLGSWGWVALAIGLSPLLLPIAGLFERYNERLIELPILLVGAAWAVLGTVMWTNDRRQSNSVRSGPPNRP